MTIRLERFPARSRLVCCGTCRRWRVEMRQTLWRGWHGVSWCNELSRRLPSDLTACGCAAWQPETMETDVLLLWQELREEGAK